MTKRFHAALAALILLASTPVLADYQVKDANGVTVTLKSRDVGGGVQAQQPILSDATGAPVTAAPGTSAPSAVGVQGVAGGVPQNVDSVLRATPASRSIIIPVGASGGTVGAGGSGATVNDVLTFIGGTCSVQPQATVSAVSSGAVTAFTISRAGSCTVLPSTFPVATTSSGAGTGATINPLYASIPTQVMATNASRRIYKLQPQGYTAYWNDAGTASADYLSYKLPADALYETPPHAVTTAAISAVCACAVPLPLKAAEQ